MKRESDKNDTLKKRDQRNSDLEQEINKILNTTNPEGIINLYEKVFSNDILDDIGEESIKNYTKNTKENNRKFDENILDTKEGQELFKNNINKNSNNIEKDKKNRKFNRNIPMIDADKEDFFDSDFIPEIKKEPLEGNITKITVILEDKIIEFLVKEDVVIGELNIKDKNKKVIDKIKIDK